MKLFSKKRVELGEGHVDAYTIIEIKFLFSIIIYNWKTIKQSRFHSHAFPSIAFLLNGQYEQEIMDSKGLIANDIVGKSKLLQPRYLPRNYTHRILKAEPNTWTIIFVGPWHSYWFEYFEERKMWRLYTHGRKIIGEMWNV